MPKSESKAGYFHFFKAGIVSHKQTGSFLPSQRALVESMISVVPPDYQGQVLELGSGTGTLTVPLAQRCRQARIKACELNRVLAEDTRNNLNRAGINGQVQVCACSAHEALAEVIGQNGSKPGYVISGIPLGNLNRTKVLELLQTIHDAMAEHGVFVQAQHLLWDRKHIRKVFGNVRTVPVLRNFPPVFVYYAQKTNGRGPA